MTVSPSLASTGRGDALAGPRFDHEYRANVTEQHCVRLGLPRRTRIPAACSWQRLHAELGPVVRRPNALRKRDAVNEVIPIDIINQRAVVIVVAHGHACANAPNLNAGEVGNHTVTIVCAAIVHADVADA